MSVPVSIGPYDLEDEIGRGGMGRVYRARHRPTGAIRALKLLDGRVDAKRLERLRREAEALARMGGAGVVAIHDAGMEPSRLYLAMEFMSGGSLRDRIRREGTIPWREAVALAAELAGILERCHAQGLVHRDVKPENILFDEERRPHLADFGIVRDLTAETLTRSGELVGTAAYMGPEVTRSSHVDGRADVFGLAVVLYEMVTGVVPHEGESLLAVLDAAVHARRRPVSGVAGVPRALDRIIDRALEADPEYRHGSAGAFRRDLEALLAGVGVARPRRPGVLLAVAGAAATAIVAELSAAPRPEPVPLAAVPTKPPIRSVPTASSVDRSLRALRDGKVSERAAILAALRAPGAGATAKDYARALEAVDHLAAAGRALLESPSVALEELPPVTHLAALTNEILRPITHAPDREKAVRVIVEPLVPLVRDAFVALLLWKNAARAAAIRDCASTAIASVEREELPTRLVAAIFECDLTARTTEAAGLLERLDGDARRLGAAPEEDKLLAVAVLVDAVHVALVSGQPFATVEARLADSERLLGETPESRASTGDDAKCVTQLRIRNILTRVELLDARSAAIGALPEASVQDSILALGQEALALAGANGVSPHDAARLICEHLIAWNRTREKERWLPDPPPGIAVSSLSVDAVIAVEKGDLATARSLLEKARAMGSPYDARALRAATERVAAIAGR